MADTGKQSPLGVNVLGSVLQNTGLTINPVAAGYMGASKTNTDYSFGSLIQNTVLRLLTWAINDGYLRGPGNGNATLTNATYNNLISIGQQDIQYHMAILVKVKMQVGFPMTLLIQMQV